ncbi:hypothetical protein GCM10027074_74150 [Streptomyces deserti]
MGRRAGVHTALLPRLRRMERAQRGPRHGTDHRNHVLPPITLDATGRIDTPVPLLTGSEKGAGAGLPEALPPSTCTGTSSAFSPGDGDEHLGGRLPYASVTGPHRRSLNDQVKPLA